MKLRFTNQEQIKESVFDDIEYEIHIHDWDTAFIVDDEENHHSVIDLMTDSLEFTVYN
jgi:hypothetical protein